MKTLISIIVFILLSALFLAAFSNTAPKEVNRPANDSLYYQISGMAIDMLFEGKTQEQIDSTIIAIYGEKVFIEFLEAVKNQK